ncbi:MAG: sialidase family protein [Promethearchaeota archaeon]
MDFGKSGTIFERVDLFKAGQGNVSCYRIPAIVLTKRGTLIAFCEARKRSCNDWAHSAIMARRCIDPVNHFNEWSPPFVVKESRRLIEPRSWSEMIEAGKYADEMGLDQESEDFIPKVDVVTNNPVPIADLEKDIVHLIYCEHYDQVFYTFSEDDGLTWSDSRDITGVLEQFRDKYDWTVIASGPGQGLQLKHGPFKGRLIVPFWIASNKNDPSAHAPSQVAIIYSDDNGASWNAGDFVPFTILNPSETKAIQLDNGKVLINSRNTEAKNPANPIQSRAISLSDDGAHDWSEYEFDKSLPEPICMGSLVRLASTHENGESRVVFTLPDSISENPGDPAPRVKLTAWLSLDDCASWPIKRVINPGPSAYSDLAADTNNQLIYCLHERGDATIKSSPYQMLSVVKFNLNWLLEKKCI